MNLWKKCFIGGSRQGNKALGILLGATLLFTSFVENLMEAAIGRLKKSIRPLKETLSQYLTFVAVHKVLRGFRPKVSFAFDKGNYTVKTVENWTELEQVLRLRHDVFHREFLNKRLALGMDFDRYDSLGDHLVIVDKETGKIVGTYRLICSEFSKTFYSASEFHLDEFLASPGIKLEMSRACIHKEYRDGVVISLLWRGVVQYVQSVKADFLFGLASIRTMDPVEVGTIYQYLQDNGFLSSEFPISPVPAYQMPGGMVVKESEKDKGKALIPPLLNSYLRAGAKISGVPALDESFECVDFLTILRMRDISKLYDRRYAQSDAARSDTPTNS
jgi:putative hemolysin